MVVLWVVEHVEAQAVGGERVDRAAVVAQRRDAAVRARAALRRRRRQPEQPQRQEPRHQLDLQVA